MAGYTPNLEVRNYIGKRCYAHPYFRDWLWSRKIKAVRCVETSHKLGTHWEVKLRNWFWHEWVDLDDVRVVYQVYK